MNHSEQQFLEPAKKTRKVVGLPESNRRSYNADDMPKCNWNGMAATIIDDIRFNTKTHKRPKAASHAYWCAYFKGCKEKRVRTAIKDALASGLLEVTHAWFNGNLTPHYRFIGTGAEFNTHAESGTPAQTGTPPAPKGIPITYSNSSSNEKDKSKAYEPGAASPSAVNTPGGEHQELAGKIKPTPASKPGKPHKVEKLEKQKKSVEKKLKKTPFVPAEEHPVSVCPNRDRLVALGYDIPALQALCADGQFLPAHWKTLPDVMCGVLLEIHDQLAVLKVGNSLDSILAMFGMNPARLIGGLRGWEFLQCHASFDGKSCQPNLASLKGHLERFVAKVLGDGGSPEHLTLERVPDPSGKERWYLEAVMTFVANDAIATVRVSFDRDNSESVTHELAVSPTLPTVPDSACADVTEPAQAAVAATDDYMPWYQPVMSDEEIRAAASKGWKGSNPAPKPLEHKNLTAHA
jgi:hypothetical protein